MEILSVSPLSVSEGERVLVTSDNVGMVLDIAKYGVEESGVVFNLIRLPMCGKLALDLLTSRADRSFTLQDINHNKVILLYILYPSSKVVRSERRRKKEREKKEKN